MMKRFKKYIESVIPKKYEMFDWNKHEIGDLVHTGINEKRERGTIIAINDPLGLALIEYDTKDGFIIQPRESKMLDAVTEGYGQGTEEGLDFNRLAKEVFGLTITTIDKNE